MDQQPEPEESLASEAKTPPASPEAPISAEDAALQERAAQVHAVVETWSMRLVDAVRSGRNATSAARMATARTASELRRLATPPVQQDGDETDSLAHLVADYMRQATNAVSNAAHEIERNRYSLTALERQLKKLDDLYKRIKPEPEAEATDEDDPSPTVTESDSSS